MIRSALALRRHKRRRAYSGTETRLSRFLGRVLIIITVVGGVAWWLAAFVA